MLGQALHPASMAGTDPLRNLMACRRDPSPKSKSPWLCQYALHPDGAIAGLNLAEAALNDAQWRAIADTLDPARLEALNLRGNQLQDNPLTPAMRHLRYLDLSNNQLKTFAPPPEASGLGHLFLSGNKDLETPPPEIVARGRYAIANYFRERTEKGSDKIYEAKVLIVGAGGSGKTSLLRRLLNGMKEGDMPTEAESTHGIEVHDKWLEGNGKPAFQAHFWDFGGQELYHATHQFFLTKRSLYLLVADARKEDTDFDYWLQIIELLGSDSPVIIVQNEKGGRSKDLNMPGLQARFANVRMLHSLDLGNPAHAGKLAHLLEDIETQVRRLPHVGEELPKSWVDIRRDLEGIRAQKQHISTEKYLEVCDRHGKEEEDALFISQFLHDLGFFLHFQDDPILKRSVILHNAWATKGVYAVLDSEAVKQQEKGKFTKAQAIQIWQEQDKTTPIFKGMHDELLQLMLKFEICYRLADATDTFIAPQLLPAPEAKASLDWDKTNNLQLRYHYTFLPKGLMSRLIVRLHRYLRDHKNEAWQSGAILHRNGASAKMLETYATSDFHFRAVGPEAKELLTLISEEVDRLNAGFHNLKVQKLVPCNCRICKDLEQPNFYEYEDLMTRKAKGKATIECKNSYDDVQVLRLLDHVFAGAFPAHKSLKVFVSYSKADRKHLETLEKHLSPLTRDETLLTWTDKELLPGAEWDDTIRHQLATADVVLLLVSADFMATDYIWKEITIAMERHERGEALIVPIIVRPCIWQDTAFARFNALPEKGQPITQWANEDEAWMKVAQQIKRLSDKMNHPKF